MTDVLLDRIAQRMSLLGGCILGGGNAGADACFMSREVGSPTECACRRRARAALEETRDFMDEASRASHGIGSPSPSVKAMSDMPELTQ